jgi:GT2 family glycosyltransferase
MQSPPEEAAGAGPPTSARPLVTVVVPVRDGGADLVRCLDALARSEGAPPHEVIVVDDASTDGSGERAAARGLRVIRLAERAGPAAARNAGAREARGGTILFVDADCEVHADTLARVAAELAADPAVVALFGSYDDRPAAPGAVSQFKNLYHHWTHQRGAEEARTFWAGCGAVRRASFLAAGGFDARRYAEPSIEDIELGYRLSEAGGRIRLAKQVQVKHLKRWTLAALVRTDVLRRGVPWMELLHERPGRGGELNLGARERLVVATGGLLPAAAVAALFWTPAWWIAGAAAAVLLLSSWSLYALVWRRAGAFAALAAPPLHVLYCLSCIAAWALGTARAWSAPPRSREAHG